MVQPHQFHPLDFRHVSLHSFNSVKDGELQIPSRSPVQSLNYLQHVNVHNRVAVVEFIDGVSEKHPQSAAFRIDGPEG